VLNGSTLYYLHDDMLGAPQLATDENQAVQWQASYDSFGQASVSGTVTQNLRLPGQYFDLETGWNHNGFRDYIPGLGRYAEPDPLGRLGSGNNPYVYVNDNPINLADPLGLCPTPKDNCDRRGPAVQIALSGGAAIIAPFSGGSVSVNIGVNVDGWSSSAFIQGQANGGIGGGAFAGWGLGINVSHGTDTTTGVGSADYAEVDAGAGLDLTGSIAHDENGCSYSGGKGLKGGEGVGLGIIAGKSGTATLATPSLGSIINWFVNNQQYF
jgi:RHS repeat-associated protein